MRWPDLTLPPFHAQLDLARVQPETGQLVWSQIFPDVNVPILEKWRWSNCVRAIHNLLVIDLTSGVAHSVGELPGTVGWPRWRGSQIIASWHRGATVGACCIEQKTGEIVKQSEWKRKGVRESRVWLCPGSTYLQVNDQLLCYLNDDLSPAWEFRAKPYIYDVSDGPDGNVWIATAGNGGALSLIDRRTGSELRRLPISGGAAEVVPIDGTDFVASTDSKGIVLTKADAGPVVHLEAPGARCIIGIVKKTIVVLSSEPRPGVLFLAVP
jgi:hypothetical protein